MAHTYDTLITDALVFDGLGTAPETADVAIKDGRIAAIGRPLPRAAAAEVVAGEGRWLMPGLIDLHTHVDLEVELSPGLPEVVRHGTTTVIASNCSLGTCFGAQLRDEENPIIDCFARVENVPKHVLQKVVERIDWDTPRAYLEHLEKIPLGPNFVAMIPHSMLRVEVMGLAESVRRDPTEQELKTMERILEEGLREGYAGFSTDALPFHYLANDPNRKRKIPTQFARFRELRRLTGVVRRHGKVWQATPATDNPLRALRDFVLTSGRLFGRSLKVTAVAAMDTVTNRRLGRLALLVSRILNSRLLRGHFIFQVLAAPFRVWADGPITPLAEAVPELRLLNEPDLEDRAARQRLYDDPAYREAFRKMWYAGKRWRPLGAKLKLLLLGDDNSIPRELDKIVVSRAPVRGWAGQTLADIYTRLCRWQSSGGRDGAADAEEAAAFEAWGRRVADEADCVFELLRAYATDFRWYVVAGNDRPHMLRKLLFHPLLLPGFNDSGAHITNMAFYDAIF